jgi:hypothetical protein
MKIDGSCHCGRITFEAEIDSGASSICHCRDCQKLTGTAFRLTVPVAAERFHLLTGSPKIYVKTADSGAARAQAFCGDCGTPIFATAADQAPEVYGIRVGTIRQRDQLAPTKQIWRRSALPWLPAMSELETWDGEDD